MMIQQAIQVGHFHPLLVHLPIGVLIFAFVLEIFLRNKKTEAAQDITKFALGVAALSALLSLGSGWLLGEDGGYDETTLFRHRWMAAAMTVCSIILYLLKKTNVVWGRKIYFPLFIITLALLGITGHLGGNMTHGEDYLFKETTSNEIAITDVNKAKVYADIIQPIFDNKCVSCHNPKKAKGELLMTDKTNLLAGGENGSILDSIKGEPSSLLTRIHLDIANEEHMPPKGKVQLTSEEKALLDWWMENENCFDCTAGFLDKNNNIAAILKSLEKDTSTWGILAETADAVSDEWITEMNSQGLSVERIDENSQLLQVNLSNKNNITKATLSDLQEYDENIVELNLGYSSFSDDLAGQLSKFKNLTKLQLQRTKITDKTVDKFEKLELLESLNLYGTAVTGKALKNLKNLKNLHSLYVYETSISETDLNTFKNEAPKVNFKHLADDIFTDAALNKPYVTSGTDFFHDSQKIELEHVFKGSNLFYTTDNSEPNTNSKKYTGPITIDESTTIKVFAQKKDWKDSEVLTAKFKKSGVAYDSVWLNKSPHKSYRGKGGKTLVDLTRGSASFQDGKWLGFQGEHFKATMTLKETKEISTISVGALTSPSSWIFFPAGFNVWTSTNGKDYKLTSTKKIPAQKESNTVETTFFDIEFEPTMARFVKLEVKSVLKNPSWHPNPGGESWVFVDEIIIN